MVSNLKDMPFTNFADIPNPIRVRVPFHLKKSRSQSTFTVSFARVDIVKIQGTHGQYLERISYKDGYSKASADNAPSTVDSACFHTYHPYIDNRGGLQPEHVPRRVL